MDILQRLQFEHTRYVVLGVDLSTTQDICTFLFELWIVRTWIVQTDPRFIPR